MGAIRPIYKVISCLLLAAVLAAAGYFFGLFGRGPEEVEPEATDFAAVTHYGDVMLVTGYLDQPIGGVHWVFLMGRFPGKGSLGLDKSTHQPNRFGDVIIASAENIEVEVTPVASSAPSPRERNRLYEIDGLKEPRLRLVSPASSSGSYRLLEVDKDGNALRVVTLEPFVLTRPRFGVIGGAPR